MWPVPGPETKTQTVTRFQNMVVRSCSGQFVVFCYYNVPKDDLHNGTSHWSFNTSDMGLRQTICKAAEHQFVARFELSSINRIPDKIHTPIQQICFFVLEIWVLDPGAEPTG